MQLKDNRQLLGLAAIIALLLAFWGGIEYTKLRDKPGENSESSRAGIVLEEESAAGRESSPEASRSESETITVYVAGAVEKADVYKLDNGARVYEAILAAGPLPEADLAAMGMARKLNDGETIYVCRPGEERPSAEQPVCRAEVASSQPPDFSSYSGSGMLNINTASQEELDRVLPGVGPALAGRIVDYRANNGPFTDISQLKEVSGIGEKKYDGIKDLITTN